MGVGGHKASSRISCVSSRSATSGAEELAQGNVKVMKIEEVAKISEPAKLRHYIHVHMTLHTDTPISPNSTKIHNDAAENFYDHDMHRRFAHLPDCEPAYAGTLALLTPMARTTLVVHYCRKLGRQPAGPHLSLRLTSLLLESIPKRKNRLQVGFALQKPILDSSESILAHPESSKPTIEFDPEIEKTLKKNRNRVKAQRALQFDQEEINSEEGASEKFLKKS
ncbi:hypothetical protein PIB30_059116 [Stylosanthes scabra]|uniref:Uncharacterized protein n=1 Tax=Stylosanthes scabra TaxID=79078 RepID=A0ABU6QJS2_9FABA|nr:hypothetical protein [Stylosanthes scabra]